MNDIVHIAHKEKIKMSELTDIEKAQKLYNYIQSELNHLPTKQECIDFGMKAGSYNLLFPATNAASRVYANATCALTHMKGETENTGFRLSFRIIDAVDSIKTIGKKGTPEYKELPCKMINAKIIPFVGEDKIPHCDSEGYYTFAGGIKLKFERVIHIRMFPDGSVEPEETSDDTTTEESTTE